MALAERLGWDVVEVFEDNDISAYSGQKRPGYQAMCKALEEGNAQALLIWHVDRLYRRPIELEGFIDLCETKRIEVSTVQSGDLDLSTASGRMVARMLVAAARHEVDHSIERMKAAKLQAALDGKFRGGPRGFGWNDDGVTHREAEAAALKSAMQRVLAGVSLRQIAREWNEAGLRTTRSDKEFNSRDVRRILLNPRNAGFTTHDGKLLLTGKWPEIIDEDTFTAVKDLLTDPARSEGVSFERKWMGTGVYLCGKCPADNPSHVVKGARAQRRSRAIYQCAARAHLTRVAEDLDGYVEAVVLERLSRPDARIVLGADIPTDVDALKTRKAAITAKMTSLMGMWQADELTDIQFREGNAKLKGDLKAVDVEIAEARKQSVLANLVLAGDDLQAAWEECSADLKGKVVDALMKVTILPSSRGRKIGGKYFDPNYIRIEWKVPA